MSVESGPTDPVTPGPGLRLAVVTTHPIQYQCPLWAKLSVRRELSAFRVFFASDFSTRGYRDREFGLQVRWDPAMLDGFGHESFSHGVIASPLHMGAGRMIRAVSRFRPHACLVNAYLPLLYVRTVLACNRSRIPVILRAESTDRDRSRSGLRFALRDAALRRLYGRISAFAAIGVNAVEHYRRLGVPESRIFRSPYCIDSDAFGRQRHAARRGALRDSLGVPRDALVLLFAGKLIPKKDPLALLEGVRGLDRLEGRPVHVWFLGDGELRPEIEKLGNAWRPGRVRILGFRPQQSLGEVYADSDMLVLPSVTRETWGLVVNEALEFGVPCIVSDRVGSARDLVEPGRTGLVFPSGDSGAMRACIIELASICATRGASVAEDCRAKAISYSIDAAVEGIVRSARAAVDGQPSLRSQGSLP